MRCVRFYMLRGGSSMEHIDRFPFPICSNFFISFRSTFFFFVFFIKSPVDGMSLFCTSMVLMILHIKCTFPILDVQKHNQRQQTNFLQRPVLVQTIFTSSLVSQPTLDLVYQYGSIVIIQEVTVCHFPSKHVLMCRRCFLALVTLRRFWFWRYDRLIELRCRN